MECTESHKNKFENVSDGNRRAASKGQSINWTAGTATLVPFWNLFLLWQWNSFDPVVAECFHPWMQA
jgi:hypothetical protein